jgi:20S proteasome alpha/beta subunit
MHLVLTVAQAKQQETGPNPVSASGTLNILLANKNGFVIAADSRMSSERNFLCGQAMQPHCDNSQKLFRTTPNSALVIAGFAVDGQNSPLNLAIASVLLKQFGPHGLDNDDQAQFALDRIKYKLSQALRNVSALHYPFDPQHFEPQQLKITFARIDGNSKPVLRQLIYTETLKLSAPLQVYVPDFDISDSGEVPVPKFRPYATGLPYVAQAIFDGFWDSKDPEILNYYERKKRDQLDSMPLTEMRRLAAAILRETERFISKVGGKDQIGVFPAERNGVEFTLPKNLQANAESIPSVLSSVGLDCSGTPCNGPISFSVDLTQPQGPYKTFYLASHFRNMPIALEDNIFIGNIFEGVTFKMHGGGVPFMMLNTVTNCTLEVPQAIPMPTIPDLRACQIVRKEVVGYPLDTVGARRVWSAGPGILIQPQP